MGPTGPDFGKSALVFIDMQNDFVHPDGGFAHMRANALKPRST